VKEILPDNEIEKLVYETIEKGGFISYRTDSDGKYSPYELNITWYSAINGNYQHADDTMKLKRYVASRAIAIFFIGIPGIYIHGLIGSENDVEAVLKEKHTRSINREIIDGSVLKEKLDDKSSLISRIVSELNNLINIKKNEKLFHPNCLQIVYNLSEKLFAFERRAEKGDDFVFCVINVTEKRTSFVLPEGLVKTENTFKNLVSGYIMNYKKNEQIEIDPYEIVILKTVKNKSGV